MTVALLCTVRLISNCQTSSEFQETSESDSFPRETEVRGQAAARLRAAGAASEARINSGIRGKMTERPSNRPPTLSLMALQLPPVRGKRLCSRVRDKTARAGLRSSLWSPPRPVPDKRSKHVTSSPLFHLAAKRESEAQLFHLSLSITQKSALETLSDATREE